MRKCPRCHKEMKENCYLKDNAQAISDYEVVEKGEDFKKKNYPIKVAICKSCGYIELYIDTQKE